jgi:dipeptidyl aminopeptidase/acylaminoacyl peptidase
MDDNSGTFPIQSERLYMALKGHGATVRYVTLPYEAHGYAARQSVLHTVAETVNWLDKYGKNAKARETDSDR